MREFEVVDVDAWTEQAKFNEAVIKQVSELRGMIKALTDELRDVNKRVLKMELYISIEGEK